MAAGLGTAPDASAETASSRSVALFGGQFAPATLRVGTGTTVTFRNGDRGGSHQLASSPAL